jgi:hypothetical protein
VILDDFVYGVDEETVSELFFLSVYNTARSF